MKKLLIALMLLAFVSCQKENYNDKFIGYWRAQKTSITMSNTTSSSAGMTRVFTNDEVVYIATFIYDWSRGIVTKEYDGPQYDSFGNLSNNGTIKSNYHCNGDVVSGYSYTIHTTRPTCDTGRIEFYDISATLIGDTLFETGKYIEYIGEYIKSEYTFKAKYTKISLLEE